MIVCKRSQQRGWLICLLFFTTLLVACSPGTSPSPKSTTQTTPSGVAPSPQHISYSCQLQQTPVQNSSIGPEIHGRAFQSELWALIGSTTGIPPRANSYVKIVWRMTGSGTFSLVAAGPQGKQLQPGRGPEPHDGSNWNRPGDEWGSFFTFPTAGCWDLHASRNGAYGDIWLNIIR